MEVMLGVVEKAVAVDIGIAVAAGAVVVAVAAVVVVVAAVVAWRGDDKLQQTVALRRNIVVLATRESLSLFAWCQIDSRLQK